MKLTIVSLWAHKLFCPSEPQPFGGAELQLFLLAKELSSTRGVTVSFITRGNGGWDEFDSNGIHVIKLPYHKTGVKRSGIGVFNLYQALRNTESDFFLQRGGGIETGVTAYAARRRRKPFVFMTSSAWDVDGTHAKQRGWLYGRFYLFGLKSAAAVVAQSGFQQALLRNEYGKESVVIPSSHTIPPEVPAQKQGILWVGRCEPVKNPQAFLEIAGHLPQYEFTMVCPKANSQVMFDEIQARTAAIKNLTFIPGVPFEETEKLFARHRIFVCTSDKEGFPNTYVQACKWGTPIISLNVNPDDMLNRHQAGKCADGDVKKQISEISSLMTDDVQWRAMSENARAYAEKNHDIRNNAARLYEILSRLHQRQLA